MSDTSDVHRYWDAIRKHFNNPKDWSMLSQQEQQLVLQSINMLLFVLNNK
jgi:hypothetical protein